MIYQTKSENSFRRKNVIALQNLVKTIHQPYLFKKSLVLFLMRVKTITMQARIQGGNVPPKLFNF